MPPREHTSEAIAQRIAELEDSKSLAINIKHGDAHALKLAHLRALAKELGTHHALASEMWEEADRSAHSASVASAMRLLTALVAKPKEFSAEQLDAMMRGARTPKEREWLLSYVVLKSGHAEVLRGRWFEDPNPEIAASGWELTARHIAKPPKVKPSNAMPSRASAATEGSDAGEPVAIPDLEVLLGLIEAHMKDAPSSLQWAMNHCLAEIGIAHASLRARALEIGERLQVLADYPTAPGCISPFAPIWIREMVARK